MRSISISELKAQLSKYLKVVKRGGEVQVVDRGVPVARLVPLPRSGGAGLDKERRERLIRSGGIRPGTGRWILNDHPPIEIDTSVLGALIEDREDRF